MLNILTHPNDILRKKSMKIDLLELQKPEFKKLIKEMTETMIKKDGAGLAAPQIGQNIRLIIINNEDKAMVMINPEITKKSWSKEIEPEGCLSVLNKKNEIYFLPVARHKKINCVYFDINGKKQKIIAENLLARIIQHETDHLDGILFIDKAEPNSIPEIKK
ncbi:MAG TPA: peptide deformylase [bacterium]|nr:peptide deformylase [bacterium]